MIVDTSALAAIVLGESDAEVYLRALLAPGATVRVSAVSLVEAVIVVEARQGPDATRDLALLLEGTGAEITSVTEEVALAAAAAWRRFGKGRHPAALNFGDCLSYATARTVGEPLLFKGEDFAQTDVAAALA